MTLGKRIAIVAGCLVASLGLVAAAEAEELDDIQAMLTVTRVTFANLLAAEVSE